MSYLGYKPYPIFAIHLKIRIQRNYLIELLQFLLSLHWLQLILRQVAATGVERISVGALTHSATALDVSLEMSEVFSLEQEL